MLCIYIYTWVINIYKLLILSGIHIKKQTKTTVDEGDLHDNLGVV